MNLSEINWDYNAAGSWPLEIKAAAILLVCCLVTGAGIYQFGIDQNKEWNELEAKEKELKDSFVSLQRQAVNLPAYKKQFKEIEALLDEMVKQMPSEAEVATLLRKVSKKAQESGLKIRFFGTEKPVRQDFYYELPNKIEVLGDYEELGLFVSSLSTLDRIVTVHDVVITSRKKTTTPNEPHLEMKANIITYREAPEEDIDDSLTAEGN